MVLPLILGNLGAALPAEAGLWTSRLFENLLGVEILRQAAEGCQFGVFKQPDDLTGTAARRGDLPGLTPR